MHTYFRVMSEFFSPRNRIERTIKGTLCVKDAHLHSDLEVGLRVREFVGLDGVVGAHIGVSENDGGEGARVARVLNDLEKIR